MHVLRGDEEELALGLLVLLGGGLRSVGIDQLLPHMGEPDAHLVHQSRGQEEGAVHGRYPLLLVTLNDVLPGGRSAELPEGATLEEHLESAAVPFVRARRLYV